MDLSVNKITKVNNKLSFQGLKSVHRSDNTPVYRFYAPPLYSGEESAVLELVFLQKDKDDNYIEKRHAQFAFDGYKPLEIIQDKLKGISDTFGYRYIILDKNNKPARYIVDDTRKKAFGKENAEYNVIDQGDNYGITPKAGPMRHTFIDSDAVLEYNKKALKKQDKDFVRNHFNKLGGSIEGLTYLLTKTNELDNYRYVISTPDVGKDELSSHGYWPNNQYQCKDINALKDFVFEMYKRGKGYVVDGAFTSQGLQSPMIQHIMKWGQKSPFYNMFKIDSSLTLGILPNRSYDDEIGQLDYIGVKLVNNPLAPEHDKAKPTYIQLFDTRLTSKELQNSNELIKAYDTNPEDHYDITTHQDSVIPYSFEVDKKDLAKLEIFEHAFKNGKRTVLLNDIENLNDFLEFKNYKIGTKADASGANFWSGNRDIIKMNLSNPSSNPANRKGFFDARRYLINVASFWTETIQSDLIQRTATMNDAKKQQTAEANGIPKEKYQALKSSLNSLKYPVLEENKTSEDYIKEFPLQSIETSPDLSAIFSEPDFNEKLLDKNTFSIIANEVNSVIDEVIPEKFKSDGEYRTYVTKLYAPAIIKNIYASALCPRAVDKHGNINRDILKDVSVYSLGANDAFDVETERNIVINKIRNGLAFLDLSTTKQKIAKEIKNVKTDDFKLAETIVLQGRAGLNWRFDAAKDIGDLDKIDKNNGGDASFDYIWYGDSYTPGVVDFWSDFIHNIKKYNPASYTVAEITCINSFTNKNSAVLEADTLNKIGATTGSNYSYYFNNLSEFVGVCPEKSYGENKAGNVNALRRKLCEFLQASQPNTAILNHMFTDNHDKPHALHTLPLNMPLFMEGKRDLLTKEDEQIIDELIEKRNLNDVCSEAVAVGLMMYKQIENSNFDENTENKLKQSLINLVNGYKDDTKTYNHRRALAFGTLPYEITVRDLFKGAGIEDDEKILNFHFNMLEKSIKKQVVLWDLMNALVGVPTLYNGEEFFQTGYETPSKNQYVGNRNQILHELKDDKRYKKYYDKIQATTGLYKETGMSALRDGFPIVFDVEEKDGISTMPIYKYDENGSEVLTLISNNGISNDYSFRIDFNPKNITKDFIELKKSDSKKVIPDGTVFARKIYENGRYKDDGKEYIIENGKLKAKDGKIVLNNPIEYFYVIAKPVNKSKAK